MWTLVYVLVISKAKTIYDPVGTYPTYKECKQALHDLQGTEKFDKHFTLKCIKRDY